MKVALVSVPVKDPIEAHEIYTTKPVSYTHLTLPTILLV